MNAVSTSVNDFIEGDAGGGSDSDTNSDGSTEYYQPISVDDGDEDVSDPANSYFNSDDVDAGSDFSRRLPNGYARGVENGISSLDLSSGSEEEEQEEERRREATDSAILRAFREDESRRNAPLTAETATRVMEAMRGVSFSGLAPVWADQVPEDQWINQLRRLRRPADHHSPLNH